MGILQAVVTIQRAFLAHLARKRRKEFGVLGEDRPVEMLVERIVNEQIADSLLPDILAEAFSAQKAGLEGDVQRQRCYSVFERVRDEYCATAVRKMVRKSIAEWVRYYFEERNAQRRNNLLVYSETERRKKGDPFARYSKQAVLLLGDTADGVIEMTLRPWVMDVVRESVDGVVKEYFAELRREHCIEGLIDDEVGGVWVRSVVVTSSS